MTEQSDPHVVITETDGTVTSFLLNPARPILKNPITGLGQVVTTGDTAERADQRTPQVIWSDQTGGAGETFYTETQGLTSFTDSDCDTRYPGLLVLPPAVTSLGDPVLNFSRPVYFEPLGLSAAQVIAWAPKRGSGTTAARWNAAGSAWVAIQTIGTITNLTAFARYRGYYLFGNTNAANGIYYSTDAVTWSNSARAKAIAGLCVHDGKIYAYNQTDNTLDWSFDPTLNTGWLASAVLYLFPGETIVQLAEWRDRVGRAVVYVVTTQRVLQYDEDADAFLDFVSIARLTASTTVRPGLQVWESNGNAYLTTFDPVTADVPMTVYEFSGTRGLTGPNLRGGLPAGSQGRIADLSPGVLWMYAPVLGTGAVAVPGRVMAISDQLAWSTVYTPQGAEAIYGAGFGLGSGYAIVQDSGSGVTRVDQFPLPQDRASPLVATRTYRSNVTCNHELAFTDGGTPNLAKQARWVAVNCRDHTSASKVPGLAANTTVVVQYRRDVDTAWTTLGTLTSANTSWPAELPINSGNGVSFKQIKIRLQLSSTTANSTPVVMSVALAYTRSEVPRYGYTFDIIVPDPAHPLYAGKDVAQQLAALDRYTQPGATVQVQFAGGDWATPQPTGTTIANAVISYSGQLHPTTGPLAFQLLASDFTPPSSG